MERDRVEGGRTRSGGGAGRGPDGGRAEQSEAEHEGTEHGGTEHGGTEHGGAERPGTENGRPGTPAIPATLAAACGYWRRRGIHTEPSQVAVAPGVPLLLLAVLAAAGGVRGPAYALREPPPEGSAAEAVLLPRPAAPWHLAQARLSGRPVRTVPVPAECGGVPDPVALLETVRRVRDDGERPHALVLSLVDDCTGTAAPPELVREVCQAAAGEGLLIVSDETWRDTSHDPRDTVLVSPAEMVEGGPYADAVVVVAGVGGTLPPPVPQAGIARFPGTPRGRAARRSVVRVLGALGARLPAAADAGAADALAEPGPLRARRAAVARARGVLVTALYRAFTDAGALCRPPHAGRHLYADLEPVRDGLAARGVRDAAALEAELTRRLGPYVAGGHRFGDDYAALRVRVSGELLASGGPEIPGGFEESGGSGGARARRGRAREAAGGAAGAPGARGAREVQEAQGAEGAAEYAAAGVPSLTPPDPLESPDVTRALHRVRSELADLTASRSAGAPHERAAP